MFGELQSFPRFSRKTDVKGSPERCRSIEVSQHEHKDHMYGSQESKRITKRPMDHVPEIQQLLCLRKEHNLLGKHHLFPGGRDGIFQFGIFGRLETYKRPASSVRPEHLLPHLPHSKRKSHVEEYHLPQSG